MEELPCPKKRCPNCDKEFYAIHGENQKYCSPKCQIQHLKKTGYFKEYMADRDKKALLRLLQILGETCVICGKTPKKRLRRTICFHNIYFKKHSTHPYHVLKHVEEFVVTCSKCHIGVHFLHDVFGMSWEEILALRDYRKIR